MKFCGGDIVRVEVRIEVGGNPEEEDDGGHPGVAALAQAQEEYGEHRVERSQEEDEPQHDDVRRFSAFARPFDLTQMVLESGSKTTTEAVDVYTTLDLHLQRLAQDAVRDGLTQVDALLSKRKRGKAEAVPIN